MENLETVADIRKDEKERKKRIGHAEYIQSDALKEFSICPPLTLPAAIDR